VEQEYEGISDSELEAILARQYEELLKRRQQLEIQRRKREEEELRRREILRLILTPEARERLANIRIAHPELAKIVEDHLIALALQGRITRQLTDEELKEILSELYERTRREFRIRIQEK